MLLAKTITISKNNGQFTPSVADEVTVLQGKGLDWAWHWGVSSIAKGQHPSSWKQEEKWSQCKPTKSKAVQLPLCCQEEQATTHGGIHSCVPSLCPLSVYHPHLKHSDQERTHREEGQATSCVLVHSQGNLSHGQGHCKAAVQGLASMSLSTHPQKRDAGIPASQVRIKASDSGSPNSHTNWQIILSFVSLQRGPALI